MLSVLRFLSIARISDVARTVQHNVWKTNMAAEPDAVRRH